MTINEEIIHLWERLPQSLNISPQYILQITAYRGRGVNDMVAHLDLKFPGILRELSNRYLDQVLQPIPRSIISKGEVLSYVGGLKNPDQQNIRDLTVDHFKSKVNFNSPNWAKRAMIGLIESGLGNYNRSLVEAGFSRCEFIEPRFPEIMEEGGRDCLQLLLMAEKSQASILTRMFTEHRARN
jgi:hypothetical protein